MSRNRQSPADQHLFRKHAFQCDAHLLQRKPAVMTATTAIPPTAATIGIQAAEIGKYMDIEIVAIIALAFFQ